MCRSSSIHSSIVVLLEPREPIVRMPAQSPSGPETLSRPRGHAPTGEQQGGAWQIHVLAGNERPQTYEVVRLVDVEAGGQQVGPETAHAGAFERGGEHSARTPGDAREQRWRRRA